ncbi:MAG: ATP synthase F1 subunit delta [Bacteroidota bacterium]
MVEDRIGYKYAKSIYSLAEEKKALKDVHADMQLLQETISESRELRNFLESPIIKTEAKEEVLTKIFGKEFKSEISTTLLQLLVRKGREAFLPHVASSFLDMYDKAHKIIRGVLTSAQKIPAAMLKKIVKAVEDKTGGKFEVSTEVNPDLIGGFTLKIDDQLFDGSVSSSIRRLKQDLSV